MNGFVRSSKNHHFISGYYEFKIKEATQNHTTVFFSLFNCFLIFDFGGIDVLLELSTSCGDPFPLIPLPYLAFMASLPRAIPFVSGKFVMMSVVAGVTLLQRLGALMLESKVVMSCVSLRFVDLSKQRTSKSQKDPKGKPKGSQRKAKRIPKVSADWGFLIFFTFLLFAEIVVFQPDRDTGDTDIIQYSSTSYVISPVSSTLCLKGNCLCCHQSGMFDMQVVVCKDGKMMCFVS